MKPVLPKRSHTFFHVQLYGGRMLLTCTPSPFQNSATLREHHVSSWRV